LLEIKKVKRKRIYEDIAEQLEEAILTGELNPGEKLPSEKELAKMFGVSKASIRQALTVLEIKGIIERKQGVATYRTVDNQPPVNSNESDNDNFMVTDVVQIVLNVPKGLLSEPLESRRIIEPNLAKLAAKRADEEDLAEIERVLQIQAEAIEEGRYSTDEDSQFHFAVAKAAKNSMMLTVLETLHGLLHKSRETSHMARGAEEQAYKEHKRIFEAIKSRSSDDAYDLMLAHLLSVERYIISHVKEITKEK
jgi:GntR family transcriptional repressor for pyruvate dehydrogenase complex